jgi:hypothetical protein
MARFDDPPRLVRAKPTSFTTNDTEALSTWLCEHGYDPIAPKQYEAARLRKRGAIVVLFASGRVLVQGSPTKPTLDLLNALVAATEPHAEPAAQLGLFSQGRAA